MIEIEFDPEQLTGDLKAWWDNWEKNASDKTLDLIKKWEETKKITTNDFDNRIWADLKKWLLENVFNGKCAYCETHIAEARQSGDAEHYRPKGGVTYKEEGNTKQTKARAKDENGQMVEHPGYFWLAYNWKNLLPSCRACNSDDGKKNQFPVSRQHVLVKKLSPAEHNALKDKPLESKTSPNYYYLKTEDLNELEDPYLLHPYFDKPRSHICFGDRGIVAVLDESNKGKRSVETYKLGDENLRNARQKAQENAKSMYDLALGYHTRIRGCTLNEAKENAQKEISAILAGEWEYVAAAYDYLRLCGNFGD